MTDPLVLDLDRLTEQAQEALRTAADQDGFRHHEGRVLSVLASPHNGLRTQQALGISCFPPGFEAPVHTHEAEEIAVFVSGSGGMRFPETTVHGVAGSVFLVPGGSHHTTFSDPGGETLVIMWIYSDAESAQRWLDDAS